MNGLFLEFRDPLFSVIIFFVIIFVIAFFSYWWGTFKSKRDYRHLNKFLKQFNALSSDNELNVLIRAGELSEKSWLLLAHSYFKSGDYEKCITIYSALLQSCNEENYKETLFLLGRTYFKAGFLERAKQIFLEILKNNPRTPQVLYYLLLVYEYMRDYKSALEVLEPLKELHKDISADTVYLKCLSTLHDTKISIEEKTKRLLKLYENSHQLTYLIFEYLFRVNPELAWKHLDNSQSELLSDILWHVDKKDLDLDIIAKNGYLRELYTARGDVDLATKSSIFEFDILINLKKKASATIRFDYVCTSCKRVYPFAFYRCTNCHAIDTSRIEYTLTKDYHRDFSEENNSFQ